MQVIINEAGGVFTGTNGEASPTSGNVIASNGRLHSTLVDVFAT